jgi:hypothetical protein
MIAPASKDELVKAIADELGWSTATTRLHLERIREDFGGIFGDLDIDCTAVNRAAVSGKIEWTFGDQETSTQQRDKFREIEQWCQEAAKRVGKAPQEIKWLPQKLGLAPRKFDWTELEFKGWQFEGQIRDELELIMIFLAVSEAAKQAADKLERLGLRTPGTIPEKKAIARLVLPAPVGRCVERDQRDSIAVCRRTHDRTLR